MYNKQITFSKIFKIFRLILRFLISHKYYMQSNLKISTIFTSKFFFYKLWSSEFYKIDIYLWKITILLLINILVVFCYNSENTNCTLLLYNIFFTYNENLKILLYFILKYLYITNLCITVITLTKYMVIW